MNDRNAATKALERAWNYLDVQNRTFKAVVLKCNGVYDGVTVFDETLDGIKDAIALLKSSYTPKEVYDTVIEHGQHDKRFKLGDTVDYTFTEVVDILNTELMCKAGDM